MKLCFSTIGCPDWKIGEIITTAKDLGYQGIEIRGIRGEINATKMREFNEDLDKTVKLLDETGIEIPMLTSGASLADHNDEDAVEEGKAYIDLANKLGVPFIRVMSTDKPYPSGGDYDLCLKRYREILSYAKDKNVTPLIETNGLFVDTALLARFLDEAGEGGGALWDVHHPFRYNDESVDTTVKNLGGKIKYVHLKDSVIEKGTVAYKMLGCGNVPLKDAVTALKDNGYDGYCTFEWVKRWNKELEDAGIVFAHYVNYMKRF